MMIRLIPLIALLLLCSVNLLNSLSWDSRALAFVPERAPTSEAPISLQLQSDHFISAGLTPSVHVASAIALPNQEILAFWYGGTREGHRDVNLYQARYNIAEDRWSEPSTLYTLADAQQQLGRYVKKLGNASISVMNGRLYLSFVTVSIGGWATAHLNMMMSDDLGRNWTQAERLVTSPFWNISTLTRNRGFAMADKQVLALPVYQELAHVRPEFLYLDSQGQVLSKHRSTSDVYALAPVAIPTSEHSAQLFARPDTTSSVLSVAVNAQGRQTSATKATDIVNPNASLDAIALQDGSWLMVTNDRQHDRLRLSLYRSVNQGEDWQRVYVVEEELELPEGEKAEFSYPWLVQDFIGQIHVFYTWKRKEIRHQVLVKFPWEVS